MSEPMSGRQIIGKLVGFTSRWNPLNTDIFVQVKVDKEMINIPIDFRQRKFIEMEHPLNSYVLLMFREGNWQIVSNMAKVDNKFLADPLTLF